jgi:putative glutamine amidotransferase
MTTPRHLRVGITATAATIHETSAASVAPAPIVAADVDAVYLDAVRGAGLVPVVLPPNDPIGAAQMLDGLDALLLTGGEDVDPVHYDETAHAEAGPYVGARDAWEIALVRAAQARRLPTLAICRGVQLLNVALGGSLVQHLADGDAARGARHDRPSDRASRVHAVTLAPGALADAIGALALATNSYHHQAIGRVAPGLVAEAWADDGVVEGVATTDREWPVLGVQWHPEELVGDAEPWDRRLFAWLATHARNGAR